MQEENEKVTIHVNKFLASLLSFLMLITLFMSFLGFDSTIPRTPIYVASVGCFFSLIQCWKSFEISPFGIKIIRFSLFKKEIPWSIVFQIVDLGHRDTGRRTSFLVVLCTAKTSKRFEKNDSVDSFLLSNSSHAFLIDYSEKSKEELQSMIEQHWGKID